jgi:quercetin dioxygenase-like cupin family protein
VDHRDEVEWVPAGEANFTGAVQFGPMYSPADAADLDVLGVRFEAGARTDWHSHPAGQVLYIVSGGARVATEGGHTVEAGPGDTVYAPAGEVHWHGAAPDGPMTHLSITHGGATEWVARKVTDEEYGG